MEFEDALFKWVSDQATVTAHIGAAPQAVRFHKLKIPQGGKTPAMVQQRSGTGRQELQCSTDGAVAIQLQVDTYARDWASMAAASRAFARALRRDAVTYPLWMGDGDSPAAGVKVKAAILDNEFDLDDPEPGLCRRTQLWTFWIWEP
jgi:hypothetical protein